MIKKIELALREFFSTNINHENSKPQEYGIRVVAVDGGICKVKFRFKRDREYCCFELGCHCGLYESAAWRRLDLLLVQAGVDPELFEQCCFHVVVEGGARNLSSGRVFGKIVSDGYDYTDSFRRTGQGLGAA